MYGRPRTWLIMFHQRNKAYACTLKRCAVSGITPFTNFVGLSGKGNGSNSRNVKSFPNASVSANRL